jgi:nucleoside-diphosphate-sugar epimerase
VRDLGKARWLVDDVFRSETAKGLFELVEVKDMSVEGAYVEAVKGVDAVVHVASNMNLDSDPNVVVPGVVAGVRSALTAAAKEATVTRFVLTSSIVAAADVYDPAFYSAHVKEDSWNEAALAQAWAPPPYDGRGLIVYEAAKIEAEKALWRFVDEEKPRFVANTVLPFLVYGPLLHEKMNQSTTGLIFELERGEQSLHSIATNGEFRHPYRLYRDLA